MSSSYDKFVAYLKDAQVKLQEQPDTVVTGDQVSQVFGQMIDMADSINELTERLEGVYAMLNKAGLLLVDHVNDGETKEFAIELLEHMLEHVDGDDDWRDSTISLLNRLQPDKVVH